VTRPTHVDRISSLSICEAADPLSTDDSNSVLCLQCVTSAFEQGSFSYFDFELHHMASVPGVLADAGGGGLSGWTERTSRPDFVFERRCLLLTFRNL